MDSADSVDSSSTVTQHSTTMAEDDLLSEESEKSSPSPTDEGKLLIVQFTVDKLSLEVRSESGLSLHILYFLIFSDT